MSDPTIYQRPAEILQTLIRFDTTNPLANERIPAAAVGFGAEAVFRAVRSFHD